MMKSLFFLMSWVSIAGVVEFKDLNDKKKFEKLQNYTNTLVDDFFPELKDSKIVLIKKYDPDSYLFTFPSWRNIWEENKVYFLYFSPRIFDDKIPDGALKAVLVHELVHFSDYHLDSVISTLLRGFKYMLSDDYITKYERETDIKAINKAPFVLEELTNFRLWLYPLLKSKEAFERKRRNYLTPEELHEIKESSSL